MTVLYADKLWHPQFIGATGILNGLALRYLSTIIIVVGLDIMFLIAHLCVARSVWHWEHWACLAQWRRADRSPRIFTCGI